MSAKEPDRIDKWIESIGPLMKLQTGRTKWNADWVPERDRKRDKKRRHVRS